tara:strand:+ start:443 stop:679 length:237 start_codon:yes stop_codon:yes gene_type:complete
VVLVVVLLMLTQLEDQEDLLFLLLKDMLEEITQVHMHLHTLEQVVVALVVLVAMLHLDLYGEMVVLEKEQQLQDHDIL